MINPSFDKTKEDLLNFLKNQDVAAIATIKSGNIPHVTTIYFHVDEELNFFFLTRDNTVKFNNIKDNHSVALVITDAEALQTVQVEGTAKEVNYGRGEGYDQVIEEFTQNLAKKGREWEKIPLNHIPDGYYAFVKITPNWIRWIDFKKWDNTLQYEHDFQANAS